VPVPFESLTASDLQEWADMQCQLAEASRRSQDPLFTNSKIGSSIAALEQGLNQRVYAALGLTEPEQWLINDLVSVRLGLIQGKLDKNAASAANPIEMVDYCTALANELDGFMDEETKRRHFVRVIRGGNYAVVEISFMLPKDRRQRVAIGQADTQDEAELRQIRGLLRKRHQSQWLYFDRALRIYDGLKTYLFKPLQRLHWLRSQALADADEIIADHLGVQDREG
jgi:hypothetical protein